jgi:hypothetical protein
LAHAQLGHDAADGGIAGQPSFPQSGQIPAGLTLLTPGVKITTVTLIHLCYFHLVIVLSSSHIVRSNRVKDSCSPGG